MMLKMLWKRLLGMTPRDEVHWRAWAVEQAIAAGATKHEVRWASDLILDYVFRSDA